MTHYALLVRGINVGGKNKVVMSQLRQELTELGVEKVDTYINSGNIFFTSTDAKAQLVEKLEAFFEVHYPFIQSFSLLSLEDFEAEIENLPEWWTKDLARKDVLFYTESLDVAQVIEKVESLELKDEVVHFGKLGIFLRQRFCLLVWVAFLLPLGKVKGDKHVSCYQRDITKQTSI